MWKFAIGFLTSYMTMTKTGKQLSGQIITNIKSDVNSYLVKEGIIEGAKQPGTSRPSEHNQSDDRTKEQPSPSETVNE